MNDKAQSVVFIAGRGMFYSSDRTSCKEILPSSDVARYSSVNGRGVVFSGDKVYVIDVKNMYTPEEAGSINIGLLIPLEGQETGIPEEFPFKSIYDSMKAAVEEAWSS